MSRCVIFAVLLCAAEPAVSAIVSGTTYNIRSRNRALLRTADSVQQGAHDPANAEQTWRLTGLVVAGQYQLESTSAGGSKMCAAVPSSAGGGSALGLLPCAGDGAQATRFDEQPDGSYILVVVQSGFCLAATGMQVGGEVQQWPCMDTDDTQRWILEEAATPAPPTDHLDLTCPASVTGDQVRARDFIVDAVLASKDPITARVFVNANKTLPNGIHMTQMQSAGEFLSSEGHPGSGVRVRIGHSTFAGEFDEVLTVQVQDTTTSLSGTCEVKVVITPTPLPGTPSLPVSPTPAPPVSAVKITPPKAVSTGLAAASMGAAASGSTLSLLGTPQCGLHADDLPLAINPLGLEVAGSQKLGGLLGNVGLVAAFSALMYLAGRLLGCFTSSEMCVSAAGAMRFPSIGLYPVYALYQGTAYCSMHLILFPDTPPHAVAGVAGLLLCIGLPLWLAWRVRMGVPWKGLYYKGRERRAPLMRFLLGSGEWTATGQEPWHRRYMSCIKPHSERTCWFAAFSFLLMFSVAALSVPETDDFSECGHLRMGIATLFVVMGGFVVFIRPYCRHRDNIAFCLQHALSATAMVLQGLGYYNEDMDDPSFATAADILQAAMAVVLLKLVVDCVCDATTVLKGRRRILQEEHWLTASEDDRLVPVAEMQRHGSLQASDLSGKAGGLSPRSPLKPGGVSDASPTSTASPQSPLEVQGMRLPSSMSSFGRGAADSSSATVGDLAESGKGSTIELSASFPPPKRRAVSRVADGPPPRSPASGLARAQTAFPGRMRRKPASPQDQETRQETAAAEAPSSPL